MGEDHIKYFIKDTTDKLSIKLTYKQFFHNVRAHWLITYLEIQWNYVVNMEESDVSITLQ